MINVSQQRALLHGIIAECARLEQERTSRAEQVMGIGHANADPYTDPYRSEEHTSELQSPR